MRVLEHACPATCVSCNMRVLQHVCPATCVSYNMCVLQHVCPVTCVSCNMCVLQHVCPATCVPCNMCALQHVTTMQHARLLYPITTQTNVVQFSVSGLSQFRGALSIRAGYEPASPSRVNINFQEATLASCFICIMAVKVDPGSVPQIVYSPSAHENSLVKFTYNSCRCRWVLPVGMPFVSFYFLYVDYPAGMSAAFLNCFCQRDPARAPTAAARVWDACWRTNAGRSGQAPIGRLRNRCLSWLMLGVFSINYDAAGCHAGRQGGAAGLRKVAGAYSSQVFACGDTSEEAILFPFVITPLDYLLSIPRNSPPPARSRRPPGHSGHILGSTCRLGGAAGGSGHTGAGALRIGRGGLADKGRTSHRDVAPD
eukprot:528313-Pelagomonas_calceolata.AAC.6